jgi:hypothetical protein
MSYDANKLRPYWDEPDYDEDDYRLQMQMEQEFIDAYGPDEDDESDEDDEDFDLDDLAGDQRTEEFNPMNR